MRFSVITPREMRFGAGRLEELPDLTAGYRRVALARGGRSFEVIRDRVHALLSGLSLVELPPQTREPEPADVDAAVEIARAAGAELIIAIGGGSVIDLGKAVAALVPQPAGAVRNYLEGVGKGCRLEQTPLPSIAIPTTAGTGAEATKNSVISSRVDGFKKSLRDPRMVPAVALIDPELCRGLSPELTALTGMDAITQLIEAYTTRNTSPVTDALALQGLQAARALPTAVSDGNNIEARGQMSLAAYLSGVCLANAGLGAAHGIAAAMGSIAPVSHGLACAQALPWVMAANLPVATERYARVAEVIRAERYADPGEGARAAIRYIWELMLEIGIPRVTELPELQTVFADDRLPALAALCHGNSLRGNPRELTDNALIELLRAMRDANDPFSLS